MSIRFSRQVFVKASLAVLTGVLLFLSGQSMAANVPGEVCDRVGETRMAEGHNNLIACLPQTGEGSPKIWKNYFPSNCNNGDLLVYRTGRFVCEKEGAASIIKNYSIEQMGKFDSSASGIANFLTKSRLGPANLYLKEYTAKNTGKLRIGVTVPGGYYHPIPYDHSIKDTYWNAPINISILANGQPVTVPGSDVVVDRWLFNPTRNTGRSYGSTTHHVGIMDIVKGNKYTIRVGVYTTGNAQVSTNTSTHQLWIGGANSSIEFMEYIE